MVTTTLPSHKSSAGNFFEDFKVGAVIRHAAPRTITSGDVAIYQACYGSRFAVQSSDVLARRIGYAAAPVDDLLVFHVVFGKTVPDLSLNAIANLGYADVRFLAPVTTGDTLTATTEIIGLRENSNRESGVVYVRSEGHNQRGERVVTLVRWVMVRKRDKNSPAPAAVVPQLPTRVVPAALGTAVPPLDRTEYDCTLAGSPHLWGDYQPGERIDHIDGMTIEEAEHQLATRLYQNTAKVHFNQHTEGQGRFKRRLVYGGVVISLARAVSFNGLANAFHVAAINGGRHAAPAFAGDTIYAWSEVLERAEIPGRHDIGALRLRTIATKNVPCATFPRPSDGGSMPEGVILDLDYWVTLPR
ncbi:MAG: MaoC family dehydratase [Hyphomicrobiaceae bacterium]|nr:MaoC family dehydratase [Hyphomicrobiaceae bacterium]